MLLFSCRSVHSALTGTVGSQTVWYKETRIDMDKSIHDDQFDLTRLISQGWSVYRANFMAIAAVVLLVSIPVNAALSIIPPYFINGQGVYDAWILRLLSATRILVFNGLIAMAVARIIDSSSNSIEVVRWSDALRFALFRFGAALSLGPLLVLFALGLLLLMLVPRLGESLYYALFMFYFFAVSLRNCSGMAAIGYSRSLFKGRFRKVFWCQFVFFLFPAVFTAGVLPLLLLLPRIPAVAIGFNAILDLFLAYPLTMSALFFIELDTMRDAGC